MAQIEMWCAARILRVLVEYFNADVCTDGVAHENDKVVGFVVAGSVFHADSARGHVSIHAVYFAVDVPGGVVCAEGLMLVITEAEEVAAVDVVGCGCFRGVE